MRRILASIAALVVLGLLPATATAIPIHRHVQAARPLPDGERLPMVVATVALDVAPADTDEDGVPNRVDRCPARAGTDGGCPVVVTPTVSPATDIAPAPVATYSGGVGNATVQCESSGDYSANTGNGYYGGYQFDSTTWDRYGDDAYPEASDAPPAVQDAAAASVPYDAWPNC
jgi:hypothetical protein